MPVITSSSNAVLNNIPDTDIDTLGEFKYILLKIQIGESGSSKTIVRGYSSCDSHAKILEKARNSITQKENIVLECLGGGFIKHEKKNLFLHGKSTMYGRANHELAATILKKKYPDYNITWNNED